MSATISLLAAAISPPPNVIMTQDEGYDLLVTDSTQEVDRHCLPMRQRRLTGTWLIPAIAQFGMGDTEFTALLDGFGKWNKFELTGHGELCVTMKMMPSGFYNESLKLQRVAPGVLFAETEPKRPCHVPWCNVEGPNDNVVVNTIEDSGVFSVTTDSPTLIDFDLETLKLHGKHEWEHSDVDTAGFDHKSMLGSAHPVRRPGDGLRVGLDIEPPMMDPVGALESHLAIFVWDGADASTRRLSARVSWHHTPYVHSFGVLHDAAPLPIQPLQVETARIAAGEPLQRAFVERRNDNLTLLLVPFGDGGRAGGEPRAFVTDRHVMTTHTLNTWYTDGGNTIVWDGAVQGADVWGSDSGLMLKTQRNRTARDESFARGRGHVERFTIDLRSGTVSSRVLSSLESSTDFTHIDPRWMGKPYCIFFANEWGTDGRTYGAMAVARYDVCTGRKASFARRSSYPSEPTLVTTGEAEAEGVLLFTLLHGPSASSSLVMLDATTMRLIEETPLPVRVPFTTHGQWYGAGATAGANATFVD